MKTLTTLLFLGVIGSLHAGLFFFLYGHMAYLSSTIQDAGVLLVLLWFVAFLVDFFTLYILGECKVVKGLALSFMLSFISAWAGALFAFNTYGT